MHSSVRKTRHQCAIVAYGNGRIAWPSNDGRITTLIRGSDTIAVQIKRMTCSGGKLSDEQTSVLTRKIDIREETSRKCVKIWPLAHQLTQIFPLQPGSIKLPSLSYV